MRNTLAFLAAALIAFLGLGWYLGWYSFKPVSTAEGHKSFNIDINADKIKSDIAKGVQKGEEKLHDVMDKEKKPEDAGKKDDKVKQTSGRNQTSGLNDTSELLRMVTPRVIICAEEELRQVGLTTGGPGGTGEIEP